MNTAIGFLFAARRGKGLVRPNWPTPKVAHSLQFTLVGGIKQVVDNRLIPSTLVVLDKDLKIKRQFSSQVLAMKISSTLFSSVVHVIIYILQ